MNIGGITSNCLSEYKTRRTTRNTSEKGFDDTVLARAKAMSEAAGQESETKTEMLVKPDGSRVLVMTMSVGGMETTMSLEISKPTKTPNENAKQGADHNMPTAENDALPDEMPDEMSDISTEA